MKTKKQLLLERRIIGAIVEGGELTNRKN